MDTNENDDAERLRFLDELSKRTGQAGLGAIDPESGAVSGWIQGNLNLERLFLKYRSYPPEHQGAYLDSIVRVMADGVHEIPSDLNQARPGLMPRLRSRYASARFALRSRLEGDKALDCLTRPLNDLWSVEIVYDTPDAIAFLPTEQIQIWGITPEEAFAIAKSNFKATAFVRIKPGLYSVSSRNYGASRVLFPKHFHRLKVRGAPVVFAPDYSQLWITGSKDEDGLQCIAGELENCLEHPAVEHLIGMVLDEDVAWRRFSPNQDTPARKKLSFLAYGSEQDAYSKQTELLMREHQGHSVSSMFVSQDADGRTFSLGVWTKNISQLLPVVDRIVFNEPIFSSPIDPGDSIDPAAKAGEVKVFGYATWERVRRVCSDLMEARCDWPERFVTKGFPSARQLQQLDLKQLEMKTES